MFAYIKRFFKHSAIYGTSNLFMKAVAVVMLPIYTRYLSPSDYGYMELLLITSSFLFMLLQMGMGSAIFRSVLYDPQSDRKILVSTAFFFLLITSFISCLFLYFFSRNISGLIFGSDRATVLLKILFATVFLNMFSVIPLAYLRMHDRSVRFSIFAGIGFLVELSLNILFVVVLRKGVQGVITAALIKSGFFIIVYLAVIRKNLVLRFSLKELKEMLGFGLPLVPAGIALTILTISDRYFLQYYSSLEEVGLYTLGYRIGMFLALVVGAFQTAWPSIMFSVAKEENAESTYARIFTFYLLVVSFLALSVSLFAREIVTIIGTEEFASASRVVPLIVVGYVFLGIYYLTSIGVNLRKKTKYEPLIVGSAALINLVLNYILIPRMGMTGAAVATVISFMVMGFVAWRVSVHFYPIRYEYVRVGKLVLICAIVFMLNLFISWNNMLFSIGWKALLLILFPLLLVAFGFFESDELEKIKKVLRLRFAG
jgi:O-antigen/teichoic acid export membrane protein